MTTAIIIPARFESTRFPGKPLAEISGKPMIEHVVHAAKGAKLAKRVIVGTDDKRIFDFVKDKLKTEVCMTSKDHKSGTDRICEVVKKLPEIKYIVNLQGDEPLMPSSYIDKLINLLLTSKSKMASLVSEIKSDEELNNPNIVKAVMDKNGFALNFSRSGQPLQGHDPIFRHIGIYAYTRETLFQFNLLPPSPLEQSEQLEQLRAIENGIKIKLEIVERAFPAVDTKEDVSIVENLLLKLKV